MAVAAVAVAAPIDDAKKLYREGRYEEALAILEPLQRKSPRNGNVNYWHGATLVALNRVDEAVPFLETALTRDVPEAAYALGRIAADDYRAADALSFFDKYSTLMTRARRQIADQEAFDAERSRLVLMENMLQRVEQIEVIDSLTVDAEAFFAAYRLAPEAGRFVSGSMLGMADVEMGFLPQSNTELFYAQPDTAGVYQLMSADILDDGTLDSAAPLAGEDLAGGGNAKYPFLMADGLTLYFANDGEGSIGGYDIFLTRRGDDGFLLPQNVGMPYNSTADDYLLAIDETTGVGWWATDRNRIPGKVTIYVFVPSTARQNVSTDDPNLRQLARLSDISLTQKPGADYSALLAGVAANEPSQRITVSTPGRVFNLPIGDNKRVYHQLSDFQCDEARSTMARAIDCQLRCTNLERRLDSLRVAYSNGRNDVASDILDLEQDLEAARRELRTLTNTAIRQEISYLNQYL